MVLHFLLGKSRHPIDVETADLATKFAEYHFQSALQVVQQYDAKNTSRFQLIAEASDRVAEAGKKVTGREVTRALSKQQRAQFNPGEISEIAAVLNQIDEMPGVFGKDSDQKQKSTALQGRRDEVKVRLLLNERKRNERRLREVMNLFDGLAPKAYSKAPSPTRDDNVVQFNLPMTGTD